MDEAFEKLAELKPNLLTVYTVMSQALNLLEQGEISMLGGSFSSYALPRKEAGAPVDLAAPTEGVFAQPSRMCLVDGGANPGFAEAYVIEILEPKPQGEIADSSSSLPSNTKAVSSVSVPDDVPIHAADWAFVSADRQAWIDRFDKVMAL